MENRKTLTLNTGLYYTEPLFHVLCICTDMCKRDPALGFFGNIFDPRLDPTINHWYIERFGTDAEGSGISIYSTCCQVTSFGEVYFSGDFEDYQLVPEQTMTAKGLAKVLRNNGRYVKLWYLDHPTSAPNNIEYSLTHILPFIDWDDAISQLADYFETGTIVKESPIFGGTPLDPFNQIILEDFLKRITEASKNYDKISFTYALQHAYKLLDKCYEINH